MKSKNVYQFDIYLVKYLASKFSQLMLVRVGLARGFVGAERRFVAWMRDHDRVFTGPEYHFRLGVFLVNARFVREHNKRNASFRVGLNKFAVYTRAEYEALLGDVSHARGGASSVGGTGDEECDWRERGVVSPVQDQGDCGSCWAFSVIQAVESQWAIQHGVLHKLSEQELVDCSPESAGCGGGDRQRTLDWVIENHDGCWMKASDYPYEAATMSCRWDDEKKVCKVVGSCVTEMMNEDVLMKAVATRGPASTSMDARWNTFMLYSQGIYDEPQCNQLWLGHAVGVVGYGQEGSLKYWIVRNSWGTDWGENGYARMIRGKGNQCGLATDVFFPVASP